MEHRPQPHHAFDGDGFLSVRWSAAAGSPVIDEAGPFGTAPRTVSFSSHRKRPGGKMLRHLGCLRTGHLTSCPPRKGAEARVWAMECLHPIL
eukprot:jgi/Botrbrau1/2257/Bobra.101_2s0081.1